MFTISRFDTRKTFICKTLVNCECNAFKKACKAWTQTLSVHVTKRPQSATFCSFFHYKLVSLQKGLHHSLHNNHCLTGLFTFHDQLNSICSSCSHLRMSISSLRAWASCARLVRSSFRSCSSATSRSSISARTRMSSLPFSSLRYTVVNMTGYALWKTLKGTADSTASDLHVFIKLTHMLWTRAEILYYHYYYYYIFLKS